MKNRVIIFVIFAGAAAYLLLPRSVETPPKLIPNQAAVIIYTPEPRPTYTPYPTYTPQPTQSPLPTYTPYPTVNTIGDWGEGGKTDQFMDVWFSRIMVFIVLLLGGPSTAIMLYQIKENDHERAHELALESMRSQRPQVRPIHVNSTISRQSTVESPLEKTIQSSLIQDFIVNHHNIGLQISKWKSRPEWTQSAIENILDWLADAGYISPRRAGVSCTWKGEYNSKQLSDLFFGNLDDGE